MIMCSHALLCCTEWLLAAANVLLYFSANCVGLMVEKQLEICIVSSLLTV